MRHPGVLAPHFCRILAQRACLSRPLLAWATVVSNTETGLHVLPLVPQSTAKRRVCRNFMKLISILVGHYFVVWLNSKSRKTGVNPIFIRNRFKRSIKVSYICSCCGHKSQSGSGGTCSYSPSRSHIYIRESEDGYICHACGHKSNSASGGSCSYSGSSKHMFIAIHGGSYSCKYCGHKSSSASGGSCSKSPSKKHEFI